MHWEVILAMVTTTLGLIAFASALERYFFRKATPLETLFFALAALGLFWPSYWADLAGFILLIAAVALQKFYLLAPEPTLNPGL
jgi:TRAP-type uncharacterized transport system fused permease subunit